MAWNQRPGPSGSGPRDGWMRQFLRRKAEQQVGMLTALRERLQRDLERRPDELPGKEWCRLAKLYQDGYRTLATLELETVKVRLLAQRANQRAPMSDEEFQREIEALGRQAIGALSVEEVEAELARRRGERVTRCGSSSSAAHAIARELHGRASAAELVEVAEVAAAHRDQLELLQLLGDVQHERRGRAPGPRPPAPRELHDRASAAERVEAPRLPPPSPASG